MVKEGILCGGDDRCEGNGCCILSRSNFKGLSFEFHILGTACCKHPMSFERQPKFFQEFAGQNFLWE
jgi:hypothetical protein